MGFMYVGPSDIGGQWAEEVCLFSDREGIRWAHRWPLSVRHPTL